MMDETSLTKWKHFDKILTLIMVAPVVISLFIPPFFRLVFLRFYIFFLSIIFFLYAYLTYKTGFSFFLKIKPLESERVKKMQIVIAIVLGILTIIYGIFFEEIMSSLFSIYF